MQVTSDTKSDHMTITLTRAKGDQVPPPIVESRPWGAIDWADLKKKIEDHHLETLQEISKVRDVDELVNRFVAWANVLLDEKYPVKRTVFKQKYTPWMTKEVLELVKEKKMLLAKYQRTRLDVHREKWLKLKTKVSNSCRKAEYEYWKDGVDSQTMWKQSYKYVGQKSPGAPTQVIVDNKIHHVT